MDMKICSSGIGVRKVNRLASYGHLPEHDPKAEDIGLGHATTLETLRRVVRVDAPFLLVSISRNLQFTNEENNNMKRTVTAMTITIAFSRSTHPSLRPQVPKRGIVL